MPAKPKSKSITLKKGKLTQEEALYIERFKDKKTIEQIAAHLRRSVSIIEKHVHLEKDTTEIQQIGLAGELRNRPEWQQLKDQFDDEELEFYQYRYMELVSQFGRDDITPADELQIFQLINFQIMGIQTMKERKPLVTQQKECQRLMEEARKRLAYEEPGSSDYKEAKRELAELESRYTDIASALKNVNNRNDSYSDKQNDLLKQLKATRDQRKKVIESGDKNFAGFLKQLTLEDRRTRMGREAEYMRLAALKEQKRLEAPHVYDDGVTDQPLLTPESVMENYDEQDDSDEIEVIGVIDETGGTANLDESHEPHETSDDLAENQGDSDV